MWRRPVRDRRRPRPTAPTATTASTATTLPTRAPADSAGHGSGVDASEGNAGAEDVTGGATGDGGVGSGPDAPPGPKFPMTLRRIGGSAAYNDRVVVRANGSVVVETRLLHGRTCTLAATQRQLLLSALTALRVPPVPPPDTSVDAPVPVAPDGQADALDDTGESDPISVTASDDLARSFDLDDSSLGWVSDLVSAVVIDVTLTSPASATCTTPSTADQAGGGVAPAG